MSMTHVDEGLRYAWICLLEMKVFGVISLRYVDLKCIWICYGTWIQGYSSFGVIVVFFLGLVHICLIGVFSLFAWFRHLDVIVMFPPWICWIYLMCVMYSYMCYMCAYMKSHLVLRLEWDLRIDLELLYFLFVLIFFSPFTGLMFFVFFLYLLVLFLSILSLFLYMCI